jgi:hypothetical protein
MFIVQKNFNMTVPAIQNPYLRGSVQLPESLVPAWQREPVYSVNPADSHRPSIVNSSVNPEVQNPFFRDPVQTAIAKTRAAETSEILANDAHARNQSLLDKLVREHDAKEKANAAAAAATINGQNLETIQDVPIIDDTIIEEEALPKRSLVDTAKIKAQVAATNTKRAAKEGLSKAKNKVAEVAGKMSEAYGDGITGSLAGDAALAAGGLALAGGAYHLLKKRRAKKKAQKEALESRIKK